MSYVSVWSIQIHIHIYPVQECRCSSGSCMENSLVPSTWFYTQRRICIASAGTWAGAGWLRARTAISRRGKCHCTAILKTKRCQESLKYMYIYMWGYMTEVTNSTLSLVCCFSPVGYSIRALPFSLCMTKNFVRKTALQIHHSLAGHIHALFPPLGNHDQGHSSVS